MGLLLRGKYLLTSAAESRVLTDAAVLVTGDRVAEVGDWPALRGKHPEARVVGNGRQLLLPGLIDAHSHGRAISPIQKGVLNDYLENNLLDWAIMPPFDPELTAALGVVRHVRSGCTTLHHMGFDTVGPRALDLCERAIRTYLDAGLRLAFSPGVRNVDKLVLDSQAFLATLPADLRAFAEPLVNLDSAGMERDLLRPLRPSLREVQLRGHAHHPEPELGAGGDGILPRPHPRDLRAPRQGPHSHALPPDPHPEGFLAAALRPNGSGLAGRAGAHR